MKNYNKITSELMPDNILYIYYLFFAGIIFTGTFLIINAFASDAEAPRIYQSFGFMFCILMHALILHTKAPLEGVNPSNKRSLSTAAKARELYSGSTSIYDTLCVLPMSRRDIVTEYMKKWRIAEIVITVILLLTAAGIHSTAESRTEADIFMISGILLAAPMLLTGITLLFISGGRKARIIGGVVFGIACFMAVVLMFMDMFNIIIMSHEPAEADVYSIPVPDLLLPLPLQLAICIFPIVFTEIYVRMTSMSGKKLYARNGQAVISE